MFSISDSCIACLQYPCLLQPCTTWPSILVFSHLALYSSILERNLLLRTLQLMSFYYFWPPTLVFPYLSLDYCIFQHGPQLLYFPTWPSTLVFSHLDLDLLHSCSQPHRQEYDWPSYMKSKQSNPLKVSSKTHLTSMTF